MDETKLLFDIDIYKDKQRIQVIPIIKHCGGYSINSQWFRIIRDMDDYTNIGKTILEAIEVIKTSPISREHPNEKGAWYKGSRYKSWKSFFRHNYLCCFEVYENGEYEIHSRGKGYMNGIGHYNVGIVKKRQLPSTATFEEMGKAVMDVLAAAEKRYWGFELDEFPPKELLLLDESTLTVKPPRNTHFQDEEDGGAAEIYQCYSYYSEIGMDSSADFFVGMASELDCSLDRENLRQTWERLNGKAEEFHIQEVTYGIFHLRAEMRNKKTHKISYFLQMEEDLLLECSMELHQPNRRKKLETKLIPLFEQFALNCKQKAINQ